ncbi:thioredoxin-like domain-containing protein [Xylariomycetidae sp. FL2044]|nr:thioredoxin-like domain-containing protein [Xylariomycetidae sp. FL2044]
MGLFYILLLSILGLEKSVRAWEHTSENEFRRAISGHNNALVAFIEPSTSASQSLEPEWTPIAASEELLMSIDCASDIGLCNEFGVISYPSLRYFDGHGNMSPYRGPRKSSSILSFFRRASRPVVTKLNDKKITTFQSIDNVVVVAHLNPRDEHVDISYKALASRLKDRASFGLMETTGTTTVLCYNNRDDEQYTLSDLTAISALPDFVEACMKPLVGEFTRANEMKYLQAGKSLVFYFATTSAEREAFVDAIRPVAKMYREYLNFVTVDADEYGDLTVPLGLRRDAFPSLSVQNQMVGQVFPFQKNKITPEAVGGFVMDIVQGKVKPWDGTPPDQISSHHDEL